MLLGRVGNLNKRGTTEQQVKDLQDYVTTLKSRLDYVLENLDEGNFTTETADKINREYTGGNTYVSVTGGGGGEETQPVQPEQPVPEGLTIGMVYPVGAIYMSVSETSPSLLFPGTTWERLKDRFLLAAGDGHPAGTEGGAERHTISGTVKGHALTVEEMPEHKHGIFSGYSATTNSSYPDAFQYARWGNSNRGYHEEFISEAGGGQEHTHELEGEETDTMPPYLTVYMWKRTA